MVKKTINVKVATVDKLWEELGMQDSIKKAKIEEKIVFYENFLNEENQFLGKIEFSNLLQSEWLNLLCTDQEKHDLFMDKFYSDISCKLMSDILQFRRYLRKQDVGQHITPEQLQQSIDKGDCATLHSDLQTLYLEPIKPLHMKYLQKQINEGLTGHDIYNWYKKDPHTRFSRILTYNVDTIKEIAA
ncbi:MAG: hypothetical protein GX340_00295 [Clostridiales bacterium]|nr:hypothetical protein [Clostridiales bacterium]